MPEQKKITNYTILAALLIYLGLCIAGLYTGEHYDQNYWIWWATQIFEHGLPQAYGHETNNYMPIMQYILYVYGKLAGSTEAIVQHISWLKVIPFAFDILGLWYIYKFISKGTTFLVILLVNMLNLAYVYNSLVWCQYDGVLSTLNFIAVYYAYKKRMDLSCLFFILALNMKLQAIILLPVIGIFYLAHIAAHRTWKSVLYPVAIIAGVQLILLIPFLTPEGLQQVWHVVTGSADTYPKISMNAMGLWSLVLYPENPFYFPDSDIFLFGMTYKTFGLLTFMLASFIALLPMLRRFISSVKNKTALSIPANQLVILCGLLYMLFYFFNTQMHERYCHPAMIFIIAYCFNRSRYLLYVLFSYAYLATLERLMGWLELNNYHTFIFDAGLIAAVNAVIILYMYYLMYRREGGI